MDLGLKIYYRIESHRVGLSFIGLGPSRKIYYRIESKDLIGFWSMLSKKPLKIYYRIESYPVSIVLSLTVPPYRRSTIELKEKIAEIIKWIDWGLKIYYRIESLAARRISFLETPEDLL